MSRARDRLGVAAMVAHELAAETMLDQPGGAVRAVELQVVTPTGEIVECSEERNPELFERVLLGYGQFGVITEATLRVRPFTPIGMRYYYYRSLRAAIEDLQWLVREDAADFSGILTMLDRAVQLLVAFDSDARQAAFVGAFEPRLRGHGEAVFALRMAGHYALHPWRLGEARYLLDRCLTLLPEFHRSEFTRDGKIVDRTVVYSRAVWRFWGGRQMVIITSSVREPDPERGRTKRQFNAQPAVENVIEHWANVYGELVVLEKNGQEHRVLHTRPSDPIRKCKTRFRALLPGAVDPTYDKLVGLIEASLNNVPKEETK